MIVLSFFEPVEDKPGYYWLNKRRCEIISEENLKKAINKYNDTNKNQLFLQDSEFHPESHTSINSDQ